MIVDLKKIFSTDNSSMPLLYELDLSSFEYGGVFPLTKPVVFNGTVANKASMVSLEAEIKYSYLAPCDRCGVETERDFCIKLSKVLATAIEGEYSESIIPIPDMKLDLDELIYSEVVVDLPMKHLCKDTCRGICQKCGKNLNDGNCNCPTKEIDPRLAVLADLLK